MYKPESTELQASRIHKIVWCGEKSTGDLEDKLNK